MALLALGNEAVVELEFLVDDENAPEMTQDNQRIYPVAGFQRYGKGDESPWGLFLPSVGDKAPKEPTKLYYYPHVHHGHVEIEEEESELEPSYREKFFEIMERHGLSVESLDSMQVVVNAIGSLDAGTVTFYGVGSPIRPSLRQELEAEVFPLIEKERPGYKGVISDTVLKPGEPRRRQEDFEAHTRLYHAGQ